MQAAPRPGGDLDSGCRTPLGALRQGRDAARFLI